MRRISVYNIFKDYMRCFFSACWIILLYCYFNRIYLSYDECISGIFSITTTLFFILVLYVIVLDRERWSYIIVRGKSEIPKATLTTSVPEHIRKVVAVHEAGHVVMAYLKAQVQEVYISGTSGHVTSEWTGFYADDMKNRILVDYAGAAAEELILGKFDAGSIIGPAADFEQAVEHIKAYILMTEPSMNKSLLSTDLSERIIHYSDKFYKETAEFLKDNRKMIETIASELQKKDSLSKKEIQALLSR